MAAQEPVPALPELVKGIKERRSVRGFLPKPVPRPVLEAVLRAAANTPSACNSQPWHVEVVTGKLLHKLSDELW